MALKGNSEKLKLREMWRCLVCGHPSWPTRIVAGESGLHKKDVLRLVRSLGKGKGFLWERVDRSKDPEYLRAWAAIIKAVYQRVSECLELLGEEVEGWEESVKPKRFLEPVRARKLVEPVRAARLLSVLTPKQVM